MITTPGRRAAPTAGAQARAATPAGAPPGAFDVVVLVGSLGGPEAMRAIVRALPADFPAAVLVVQHRSARARDLTVALLAARSAVAVCLAQQGDCPRRGTVHVAPAARSLVLGPDGRFAYLPAPPLPGRGADPLLASVAEHYGRRALGVILSGANDDGAAGVVALKQRGGRALAQDHRTARCLTMPAAAIATGCVDFVLPLDRIAPALVTLTMVPGAADLFRVPSPSWARLVS